MFDWTISGYCNGSCRSDCINCRVDEVNIAEKDHIFCYFNVFLNFHYFYIFFNWVILNCHPQQTTSNDGHLRHSNPDATRSKPIHSFDFVFYSISTYVSKKIIICWPKQVEPVQIWSSTQLIKIFEELGVNEKIGLSGRPVSFFNSPCTFWSEEFF